MTEAEWLECTDPFDIVDLLGSKRSDRKFRLFGCACVRGVWEHLPDERLRQATETCERFADGLATSDELRAAEELASDAYEGIGDIIADHSAIAVRALCSPRASFPMGEGSSAGIAAVAAEAWSNREVSFGTALEKARSIHCELLRDIFSNPFRPVAIDDSLLTWKDATIPRLAQAAYDERELPSGHLDAKRLAILADALEEAGSTNEEMLGHLRGPGPHVRGCWVVDLLLEKE